MSKYNIGEVEVDFLSSYYEQDGNHGAVLGGTGSQALNDIVFSISLNVPIDSQFILSTSVSFDSYTSASSSAIDPGIGIAYALRGDDFPLSGPSYKDQRTYGNVNFTHLYSKGKSYNIGIGFSNEYDVSSFSMNGGYGWESNDENTSVQLNIVGLRDKWSLIYPVELRYLQNVSDTLLNKDVRNTYNGALIMSRVINPIWQLAFIYDYTYQYGLLSTPFHRVIFDDGLPIDDFFKSIGIEKLPNYRHKHAVGLRSSLYPIRTLVVRNFFRYYSDSYGIESITAEIETPIKITRFFSLYPFYRYYQQTAADFFEAINTHRLNSTYYTSDYDLSKFDSHKFGFGMRISPPYGLGAVKKMPFTQRRATIKEFNIRGGVYDRSDGLHSYFVSAVLSITI